MTEKRYILGVPKIGCRTGNEQAEACLRTLDDWGLRTSESSSWYMVYDITASNTRLKNDACTFIENSNLARINLDDLPPSCHGTSSCCFRLFIWTYWRVCHYYAQQVPAKLATHRLGDKWNIFPRHPWFTHFCSSRRNGEILQGSSWRVTSERRLRGILETQFHLQGGAKGARVSFQAPGAFHHAHLMVKAIFSIEIFIFQQLFSPTAKEKHSVMELALFVSLV